MQEHDSPIPRKPSLIGGLQEFLRLEAASGILLVIAAILAMIVENSPLSTWYEALLGTPVEIRIGDFQIAKALLLWINDGLMAVFFLLVGLELKREIVRGELRDRSRAALPAIAALGGFAVPALIYSSLNWGDPLAMTGWAIPSATDIAFALGVLSLLGDRVPAALKLFLLTLAIVDDLAAILVIAFFYTADLSVLSLVVAGSAVAVLTILNRRGVLSIFPYLAVGLVLWAAVLKSGVHATLAGVVLAMFIPLKREDEEGKSPAEKLEHDLHPTVAFAILPLFAFANTGISLSGLTFDSLIAPVPLGIALGLVFGNQIGVMSLAWISVKLGIGRLPDGVSWKMIYGASCLCGIGFTMSLFISSLAFEQGAQSLATDDRLGILMGSLISAAWGVFVLRRALPKSADELEATAV
jgi:NhaA family Na+:H+ antiporter